MAKAKKRTVKQMKEDDAKRWERETTKAKGQARPYMTSALFVIDQVINHESFGLGVVTSVADKKIEVIFEGQRKLLIHNINS